MKLLAITLGLAVSMAGIAAAQSTAAPTTPTQPSTGNRDETSNPRLWQAKLPTGHYMVRLDKISSASKHEYISDGVARVVEVTIGTESAVVARFYYLEPAGKDTPISAGQIVINRAQEVQKTVADKVSPSMGKLQVVKNYPVSTHAHTVEYVVQTEEGLNSLYGSLTVSINTGQGRTWISGDK
jgi:hypothetical protein